MVLLLLSYLLYDDSLLFPTNTHGDQQSIGTISTSENDVRRKNNDNFIWLPGNKKDEVYNRDSIFTGDRSQAAVTLTDGSLIQIQENSLVNLNLKNGQMQLDLRFGQLSGTSTPLLVKSGNEEFIIDGKNTKFEINRAASGDLDVKVLSGKVEIKGKKGSQKLNAIESLKISEAGAEKMDSEASVHLLTQNDILVYRTNEKDPIAFAWEGKGLLIQYQLELSKTEDFKKVFIQKTTTEQKLGVKDVLHDGTYYWRVKGLNSRRKNVATSENHKFYLSQMPAPTIQEPADNITLKITTLNSPEGLKATTKVTWDADPRLISYEWQLAKDSDFKEPVENKSLKLKSIETAALFKGVYYTRVRGLDKDKRPSPWSAAHSFNFEIDAEKKPPAPKLAEKRIRFQIPKLENRAPSAEDSPQMAWSKVSVAKNYHWELSKDARFVGAQVSDLDATKIAWTQYQPGKYYYRVFTRTARGQMSDASETGVLEVLTDRPILNPIPAILVKETKLEAQPEPKDVKVQWSSVPDAKSYIVEIDKTPEFTAPVQVEAVGNQSSVHLPTPGKYFVRVKALNDSAADISEFSNVQDANYVFQVTLKSPELVEPDNKSTMFLQKDSEPFIWLAWNPVDHAQKYVVEASLTQDFAAPFISKQVTENRFLIKSKIPYGNIFWRVKALAVEDQKSSDWSGRYFILYHQRNQGF